MTKKEIMKDYRLRRKNIKKSYKLNKRTERQKYRILKKELREQYKKMRSNIRDEKIIKVTEYYENKIHKPVINPPRRSILEEIGNAITHGIGTLLSIAGYILLLIASNTKSEYIGSSIYFVGLFLMFTMSCLYHAFSFGSRVKRIFRRFDYSSIYFLIGATFAPILLCYVGGTLGLILCIVQWLIIITGVTFISIYGPTKLKFLHFPLYIVLGWCGVLFLPQMAKDNVGLLIYTLVGGVIYTLGMIPFWIDKKVCHFLWHIFVIAGAIVQWFGIYLYIYLK